MRNRTTAAILAIILGAYGAQKFYIGEMNKGWLYLIVTIVTCHIAGVIFWVLSLIEGIKWLQMTDEEFEASFEN
ncbi:MAG: TM2 domain-containing protein [Bacteroidaceae bacterium]|nr:TM2 domain-containing protein [Bacteroidaceae bacterium]